MTAQEQKVRLLTKWRSGGMCEVCAVQRATTFHHRLPEGQGGPWRSANGLHVCGDGTVGCHGWIEHHRARAYERGWLVHSWDDFYAVPALLRLHGGWVYLHWDGKTTTYDRRTSVWAP
ncbi:hypothetical protein SAMN06265360_10661 [Haloechinothrix alba]|uniref:HNH endonuclease n=1 Tax=Haloechinothrix alba TaxID=664784 RepID=A0A238WE68_9PSEU|nr:hypothetical protein [Haloechinothrix alba]SNR44574.1 hypothetical protein SAMN06265360_10661 [Haloechinothrix alba]